MYPLDQWDELAPALAVSLFVLCALGVGFVVRLMKARAARPKPSVSEQLEAIRPLDFTREEMADYFQAPQVQYAPEDDPPTR
jgi:hypothetical protein